MRRMALILVAIVALTSSSPAQGDAPFDSGTSLVVAGSRLEGVNSYYVALLQALTGTRWLGIFGAGVQSDSDENFTAGAAYRVSKNVYLRYDFSPLLEDNTSMEWNRHIIGAGINGTFEKVFEKIGIGLPDLDFLIDVGMVFEDKKESQSRISFGLIYDF